jgi:phosphohistidine phosphatase SixA
LVIFLLRHADRQPDADDLSELGRARAEQLARMLAETGIGIGYCSDAQRTRRTLDPLVQKRGSAFKVVAVPADGPGGIAAHVDKVAAELRALPAEAVAAVVGHTNTVPQIIAKLGAGSDGTAIGENEFDRLFVLFLTPGRSATLLRLRYGAATRVAGIAAARRRSWVSSGPMERSGSAKARSAVRARE